MDFGDITTNAIGGFIGALALLLLVPAVRSKLSNLRRWFMQQLGAAKASEAETGAREVYVLRGQVLDTARERGIVLPATAQGSDPIIITFSDGGVSYIYRDWTSYKQAMNSNRRTDPQRSGPGPRPHPVSRWSRAELEAWLKEHATP